MNLGLQNTKHLLRRLSYRSSPRNCFQESEEEALTPDYKGCVCVWVGGCVLFSGDHEVMHTKSRASIKHSSQRPFTSPLNGIAPHCISIWLYSKHLKMDALWQWLLFLSVGGKIQVLYCWVISLAPSLKIWNWWVNFKCLTLQFLPNKSQVFNSFLVFFVVCFGITPGSAQKSVLEELGKL